MLCCTFIGLLLTQLAAVAGIVKIDRSNSTFLHLREGLPRMGLLAIASAALGLCLLGGGLAYAYSTQNSALGSLRHNRICSAFGIAPPASVHN